MNSLDYVAFLRGINVGGNMIIGMEDLKKAFAALGFANIRTVLATGNVVFESPEKDRAALTRKIEQKLKTSFKSEISVIVRTMKGIQSLVASRPFKSRRMTPQTKLQVSFLSLDLEEGFKTSQRFPGS